LQRRVQQYLLISIGKEFYIVPVGSHFNKVIINTYKGAEKLII
jgi:hypothetical protein